MLRRRPPSWVLLALFAVSGGTGLLFQILWLAGLSRVFGATAEAAAATLLAFFLGLALGALFWGRRVRRVRRPLRAYAALELGVAAAAGLWLLLDPVQILIYGLVTDALGTGGWVLSVARLALTVLLIGPAAFLMGGTLPVLGEYVVRDRLTLGTRGSLLYAANTMGAVAGVLLGAFVLPERLGFRGAYFVTMAITVAVGLIALLLSAREEPRVRPDPAPQPRDPRWRKLLVLSALSGLLALALQVLWTRLFAQSVQNSVQSFAAILAVYLLALAGGGALAHLLARRTWRAAPVLAFILALGAFLTAASLVVFRLSTGPERLALGSGWGEYLRALFGTTAVVIGPPVLFLGTVFPYLMRAAQDRTRDPGAALGALGGWNTLGAAVGAPLAGFVLLPAMGPATAIRVVALAYAALAVVVAWTTGMRAAKAVSWTVLVATIAALFAATRGSQTWGEEALLDVWEGAYGTVAVVEQDGVRKLRLNRVFTLGGSEDDRWETLQTRIALLPHSAPRDVFYLGMGTGITAGAALDHPVERVVVAELVPEVATAARLHFEADTNGLFASDNADRVTIVAEDGRHRLRWEKTRYDVVIGDLFFPWETGAADLYTREHFEAVQARLRPGGRFVQWLPCYQLSRHEFEGIARTMTEVFGQVTLWRGDFAARRPVLGLVGEEAGATLDPDLLVAQARALPEGEISTLQAWPTSLPFCFYAGNLTEAVSLLSAPILTEDRPWIAWDAPREQRRREGGEATAFVEAKLLAFEEALAEAVPRAEDPYLANLTDDQRRRVQGGLVLRQLSVASKTGDWAAHRQARHDLLLLVPAVVRPPLEDWVD